MRPRGLPAAFLVCFLLPLTAAAAARADTVLACFEGTDYGGWKATGEAFGPGPARGTLPDQMPVSGYVGHGLANTFFHGDAHRRHAHLAGVHTSTYKYLNFLIGGGNHPGKTCLNLRGGRQGGAHGDRPRQRAAAAGGPSTCRPCRARRPTSRSWTTKPAAGDTSWSIRSC